MRSPRQTNEPQQATFVFKGTIKKLKSATMKDVPLSEGTAIVTVDQIIEAPTDLAGYAGQDITVQLSGRQNVRVGLQMLFHAIGWMFGDSVAVRSLRQEPVENGDASSADTGDDPVKRRAQKQQRSHFEDADLVVAGEVVAVRLPGDSTPGGKRAGSRTGPITEHEPQWREAIIQVDEVLKGTHEKKQVVVRFPASTDVMWHGAPKFEAGQQGYFILHKTESKKSETKGAKKRRKARGTATEKAGKTAEYYLARDSADFQPYDERGGVRALLETESIKRK